MLGAIPIPSRLRAAVSSVTCDSAPNYDPFRRQILTPFDSSIFLAAERVSAYEVGSLLGAERVKRHAGSQPSNASGARWWAS
jgi:hypothetical protein